MDPYIYYITYLCLHWLQTPAFIILLTSTYTPYGPLYLLYYLHLPTLIMDPCIYYLTIISIGRCTFKFGCLKYH